MVSAGVGRREQLEVGADGLSERLRPGASLRLSAGDSHRGSLFLEDLFSCFTLTGTDRTLVPTTSAPANRIGFALSLCAVRYLGFCPEDLSTAPESVLWYVSEQLGVPSEALRGYGGRAQLARREGPRTRRSRLSRPAGCREASQGEDGQTRSLATRADGRPGEGARHGEHLPSDRAASERGAQRAVGLAACPRYREQTNDVQLAEAGGDLQHPEGDLGAAEEARLPQEDGRRGVGPLFGKPQPPEASGKAWAQVHGATPPEAGATAPLPGAGGLPPRLLREDNRRGRGPLRPVPLASRCSRKKATGGVS
jgi:uncharacterized protein DUF4158